MKFDLFKALDGAQVVAASLGIAKEAVHFHMTPVEQGIHIIIEFFVDGKFVASTFVVSDLECEKAFDPTALMKVKWELSLKSLHDRIVEARAKPSGEGFCSKGCGRALVSEMDEETGVCPRCWESPSVEDNNAEYKKQMKDSDTVFTAISTAEYANFETARRAIVLLYVPDMSFSRGGISHALKRLERHYRDWCTEDGP